MPCLRSHGLCSRKNRSPRVASFVTLLRPPTTTRELVTGSQTPGADKAFRNWSVKGTAEVGQEITALSPFGARVIRSVRDASETTVVVTDAALSGGLRSDSTKVIAARLVNTASLDAMTVMAAVSLVPLVMTPRVNVTIPPVAVEVPRLEL